MNEETKNLGEKQRKRRLRPSITLSNSRDNGHLCTMNLTPRRMLFLSMMFCAGRSMSLMNLVPILGRCGRHWRGVSVSAENGSYHDGGRKLILRHSLHRLGRSVSPFLRLVMLQSTEKSIPETYLENSHNELDDDGYPKTDSKAGNGDKDDADANEYFGRFISEAVREEESTKNANPKSKDFPSSEEFISSSSSSLPSQDEKTILHETKQMMEKQQQQIDLLMKLVQENDPKCNKSSTISHPYPQTQGTTAQQKSINVAPLKAMLFIDGTWLYYSLNNRNQSRDAIIPKFGMGWQNNYKVDWQALPRIICAEIEKQRNSKTSFKRSDRPLEIARVMVFTSAKKETDPNSIRMRMFREMANANYDLHMMETIGAGEKCVDIQLAVEMLHYATVPNAYDVAILLSGDKDFVPALVRTRQKGKQVCIGSMRAGCNRVLYESPHIRDYDVVWLENRLDELIVPIPPEERSRRDRAGYASSFTMMRVVRDFVEAAPGYDWVSSRDIGKYLKKIQIADSNMLEELKQAHGGLRTFVMERACNLFDVKFPEAGADHGPGEFSFWVRAKGDSDDTLLNEFKRTQFFTREEKDFLENYKKEHFIEVDKAYLHTAMASNYLYSVNVDSMETLGRNSELDSLDGIISPALDYSQLKVVKLRDICRQKGLPVSGKKLELINRLERHRKIEDEVVEKQYNEAEAPVGRRKASKRPLPQLLDRASASHGIQVGNIYSSTLPQIDTMRYRNPRPGSGSPADSVVASYLEALIKEYLTASGGTAGSRDIGRYLSANSDSHKGHRSALSELKQAYGSLLTFILSRENTFAVLDEKSRHDGNLGVPVKLINMRSSS